MAYDNYTDLKLTPLMSRVTLPDQYGHYCHRIPWKEQVVGHGDGVPQTET